MVRLIAGAALCLLIAGTAAAAGVEIVVDAGQVVGPVRPLNGVNAGPAFVPGWPPGRDCIEQYRAMGLTLVRTHDLYGPCDLSTIFPGGWGADPDDPANYDFTTTDAALDAIEAAGCAIMFRLGESWNTANPHNAIPPDFLTVARVCERIVERYRERVALWEIWNEPNHHMFWDRQADPDLEQFADMYAIIATRLKTRWPELVVGGPGMAGGDHAADLARDFAAQCHQRGAPLDFYSWHFYNRNQEGPLFLATTAEQVRQALDDEGYPDAMNILSEWNSINANVTDAFWRPTLHNADGAAFAAAALIYLHQHCDMRYALRYRGDCHGGATGYGFVRDDGSLKRPGYAYLAYAQLFPGGFDEPRLMLHTSGGDLDGRAVMATTDEPRSIIAILVAQFRCGGEPMRVIVRHLPADWSRPVAEHVVISAGPPFARVARRPLASTGTGAWRYDWAGAPRPGSDVHLLRVFDRP